MVKQRVGIPLIAHQVTRPIICRQVVIEAVADRWEPHTTGTDYSRRTVEAFAKRYASHQPLPQKPKGTELQVIDRRYKLVDMAHAVYHAGYVFLPITFENGIPRIHWQEEWRFE